MSGRTPRWIFTGTVAITYDPVLRWESFAMSLNHEKTGDRPSFDNIRFGTRAEGGYYRAYFRLHGPREVLEEMFYNGLGREIKIYDPQGVELWEGKNFEMNMVIRGIAANISLKDEYNNVWLRYRTIGGTTTISSTAQTDAPAQGRYGKRDFVLSGGELNDSSVADQLCTRIMQWQRAPKPVIIPSPQDQAASEPYVDITCIGYMDTFAWQVYNQTASTGTQGAAGEMSDLVTAKGQYIASSTYGSNATPVTKVYNVDRKAGDIGMDVARLGSFDFSRWVIQMWNARAFRYQYAAPPTLPSSSLGGGAPVYDSLAGTGTAVTGNLNIPNKAARYVLLDFGVYYGGGAPAISAVTVGGQAASRIKRQTGGAGIAVEQWGIANPPYGAAVAMVVTVGTYTSFYYSVHVYTGVDASNPYGDIQGAAVTAHAISLTLTSGLSEICTGFGVWNANCNTSEAVGETERDDHPGTVSEWATEALGAVSVTFTDTKSTAGVIEVAIVGCSLKAAPMPRNRAIAYWMDIWDPDRRIYDNNGNVVPPWLILADRWIQITGVTFPTVKETTTFIDDPTKFYIEENEWKDGQDIPTMKNSRGQMLDVALARLVARSSV